MSAPDQNVAAPGEKKDEPLPRRTRRGQTSTAERIIEATVRALNVRRANKLQFSEICAYAGVSRNTLYRYFPTMEDLLAGVADHARAKFERELHSAVSGEASPRLRLQAALSFLDSYVEAQRLDLWLELEPRFVMQFLRGNYSHYCATVARELGPVFDEIESVAGYDLDRALCTDLVMRNAYSAGLLPHAIAPLNRKPSGEEVWQMLSALKR